MPLFTRGKPAFSASVVAMSVAVLCSPGVAFQPGVACSGYPNRMHTCKDGEQRTRFTLHADILDEAPVNLVKDRGWKVFFSKTHEDRSLDQILPASTAFNETLANSYEVSMAAKGDLQGEVTVGVAEWMPLATEAVIKASAGVTVTRKPTRTESFSAMGSSNLSLKPCSWWTTEVLRQTTQASVTQKFVDMSICGKQNSSLGSVTTFCNDRSIVATSDGTVSWRVVETTGVFPCP